MAGSSCVAMRARQRLKCDGTCAETRFLLSGKRTGPFKSAGASVKSTAGSQVVRIRGSNAGYTKFRGSVRVLATHSIRQFPFYFPSRASPCAITFQTYSTTEACAWTVMKEPRKTPSQVSGPSLNRASAQVTERCIDTCHVGAQL